VVVRLVSSATDARCASGLFVRSALQRTVMSKYAEIVKILKREEEMNEEEIRLDERQKIQKYIDENNIYQVEFEHYEPPLLMKWIPLKTHRISIEEGFE